MSNLSKNDIFINFIRVVFIILTAILLWVYLSPDKIHLHIFSIIIGLLGGIILVIGVEKAVYYLHFQKVLFGIIGLLLGTILIWLVNPAILQIFSFFGLSEKLQKFLIIFMYHIFGLIFLFLFYLNFTAILHQKIIHIMSTKLNRLE